jgi:hypothetical protein
MDPVQNNEQTQAHEQKQEHISSYVLLTNSPPLWAPMLPVGHSIVGFWLLDQNGNKTEKSGNIMILSDLIWHQYVYTLNGVTRECATVTTVNRNVHVNIFNDPPGGRMQTDQFTGIEQARDKFTFVRDPEHGILVVHMGKLLGVCFKAR